MRKTLFIVLLSLLVLLTACNPAPEPVEPTEEEVAIVSSIMGASMQYALEKQGISDIFDGTGAITPDQITEMFDKLTDINVTVEEAATVSGVTLNSGSIKMKYTLSGDISALQEAQVSMTLNIDVNATVGETPYDFYMSGSAKTSLQELMEGATSSISSGFTVKLGDKYLDMTKVTIE